MTLAQRYALKLKTPEAVQLFLQSYPYNQEKNGETVMSAETALKKKYWHCLEATFVAAAILENHDYPPLVLSLESKDQLDHVLFLFQEHGLWGTISRSRDRGLEGRRPVFKTIKQLVWDYYDHYIDRTAKITRYQIAHLDEISADWRQSHKNVWQAEQYLIDLRHNKFPSSRQRYRKIYNRVVKHKEILPPEASWW